MSTILVDGSNVLYWRGGQAQRDVPLMVVRALLARRFTPLVYFDHSIHRYLSGPDLEQLRAKAQVTITLRGTPADALLLAASDAGRFQIVSADRFRTWRRDYPHLRADWLVTGRIGRGAQVTFSKKLKPVPI